MSYSRSKDVELFRSNLKMFIKVCWQKMILGTSAKSALTDVSPASQASLSRYVPLPYRFDALVGDPGDHLDSITLVGVHWHGIC